MSSSRAGGILVAPILDMTNRLPSSSRPGDQCLLRWVFRRGSDDLTCEVDSHGDDSFDLQLLVGWSPVPSISEHFSDPLAAFERHAEVSRLLRDAGWAVTEHTQSRPTA